VKHRKANPGRLAFTLIELLVVVVILAILMAVALPLYLGAVADSERSVCRANMQSISDAEQAYRVRNPVHTFTTDLSNLTLDLGTLPICPRQGSYSTAISNGAELANNGMIVPSGGIVVKCSASGHGVFAPSIDGE